MVKILIKTIVFYMVFLACISIPAVYDIFIIGHMDRKFSHSPWMALEVYYFGSAWIWFYLVPVFFVFSWVSSELNKLDISYVLSIGIAFITAFSCFLYTRNEASAWDLTLRPDYLAIIILAALFLIISFMKRKKSSN